MKAKNIFQFMTSFILMCSSSVSNTLGQSGHVATPETVRFEKQAEEGTYQFIASSPDSDFVFTRDVLVTIEKKRRQNDEVILQLNDQVRIRIYPEEKIRKGFRASQEIVFEPTHETTRVP